MPAVGVDVPTTYRAGVRLNFYVATALLIAGLAWFLPTQAADAERRLV